MYALRDQLRGNILVNVVLFRAMLKHEDCSVGQVHPYHASYLVQTGYHHYSMIMDVLYSVDIQHGNHE